MGRIGRVLSYLYKQINEDKVADIKIDTGGGANTTVQHFQPTGEDAQPLPQDLLVVLKVPGMGREVAIAFVDPKNEQLAGAGEKRLYSRKADGSVAATFHLKADGTITMFNDNATRTISPDGGITETNAGGGSYIMAASDGAIKINGVKFDTSSNVSNANNIDAGGKITIPNGDYSTSLKIDSKELKDHDHDIASGSSAPGPTEGNN